jgi:hypothetical protein
MSLSLPPENLVEKLPHYAPEAIYKRYVAARLAWYESQPRGTLKTNQAYRRAVGLPLRYQNEIYIWCQYYKQMGKFCVLPGGRRRGWTKEEMMAYLDWDTAEGARVDEEVEWRVENDPNEATRRGMGEIWRQAEEDGQAQASVFS